MLHFFVVTRPFADGSPTLVIVLSGHGDTEPASSGGALDRRALDKNLFIKAALCDLALNINTNVLRLQVNVESICGHELRNLKVEDQLSATRALI